MMIYIKILFCLIGFVIYSDSIQAHKISHKEFEDTKDSLVNNTCQRLQKKKLRKQKHKESKFYKFLKSLNDTEDEYVIPNFYNFTAMVQQTSLINAYSIRGKNADGYKQQIRFYSKPHLTLGPYIGWHWVFLGYNFDLKNASKSKKSTQFNLSLYSSAFGADMIYQKNNGDFKISKVKGFGKENDKTVKNRKFDGLETSITSLNVYYIFNHKRFSYPAAYGQSTVQRKSCGTWKLGFIFSHQKLDFDYTRLPESMLDGGQRGVGIYDELKFKKINYYDYGINFGYAYNWVFAPNFLCSVSLAPAVGYKFAKGESFESRDLLFKRKTLNFDAIGRMGLVWNTNRFFLGTSAIVHAYSYSKSKFSISNAVAVFNIYCGINFMPKSHYRRTNPKKFKKW